MPQETCPNYCSFTTCLQGSHSSSAHSRRTLTPPDCSRPSSTSESTTKATATEKTARHTKRLCVELAFFSPCCPPGTKTILMSLACFKSQHHTNHSKSICFTALIQQDNCVNQVSPSSSSCSPQTGKPEVSSHEADLHLTTVFIVSLNTRG